MSLLDIIHPTMPAAIHTAGRRVSPLGMGGGESTEPPKEEPMPKGVYKRAPKAEGAAEPAAPRKTKRTTAAKPGRQAGDAEFLLSDRGSLTIRDGQQEIRLEARDVDRLRAFVKAK